MFSIEQKIQRKQKIYNRKKKKIEEYITLETHEQEMIEYFQNLQDKVLPEKIIKYKKALKNNTQDTTKLLEDIQNLKDCKEEVDYFTKVGHILFDYETVKHPATEEELKIKQSLSIEYFTKLHLPIPKQLTQVFHSDIKKSYSICKFCSETNCIVYGSDDSLVCKKCALSYKESRISEDFDQKIIDNYSAIAFTSNNRIVYQKIKYFDEWLKQIQAKENSNIPMDVINLVNVEVQREKIKDNLNINNVKRILKKINMSKYYENIPTIIYTINGLPPLDIPRNIEHTLRIMFKKVEVLWDLAKPKGRHNFFSYPYLIHKFCQILNLTEYLVYFPLLKSREKLYKQDTIWKKIIDLIVSNTKEYDNDYNLRNIKWKFIPSV